MCLIIKLLAFFALTLSTINAWAWDDEKTHPDLSAKATEYSILNVGRGDYLKNLGFDNNIDERFILEGVDKKLTEWIRHGAFMEDEPLNIFGIEIEAIGRFYKHFHNPLKEWDKAGLTLLGESSLTWAQNETKNEWAWQKVRDYYHLALTDPSETERSANFAKTFRGLGQIIHLIQDKAQPAHVRNDMHPLDNKGKVQGFEWWAKQPENNKAMESYMSDPVFSTVPLDISKNGKIPISQFWDTDQYDENNLPYGTGITNIGLAEFTNLNFFSEDTIFTSDFAYPSKNQTDAQFIEVLAEDGQIDKTTYIMKTGQGYKLAAYSYLKRDLDDLVNGYGLLEEWKYKLDDEVYKDYAKQLIPRAVGYSAGLLNYFFRGKIDMVTDPDNEGSYMIENLSGEIMKGKFDLYYDDKDGNRTKVEGWSDHYDKDVTIDSQSEWKLKNIALKNLPDPAPNDDKYILVFNGKLGNESGATVGKVVDLSGGRWEDWNGGVYSKEDSAWSDPDWVSEDFTLNTKAHIWSGQWYGRKDFYASLEVKDGMLAVNKAIPSWIEVMTLNSDTGYIPIKGSRLQMNIPYAEMNVPRTYCDATKEYCDTSGFYMQLGVSNGSKKTGIDYGILEATTYWDFDFYNGQVDSDIWRTWIGAGDIDRNIEADIKSSIAERAKLWPDSYGDDYWGDINNWHIVDVKFYSIADNSDTHFSFKIDYIDFACEEE